jgi:uncharacterized protein (DUF362 family)
MSDKIFVIYGANPESMVKQLLEQIRPEQGLDQNALIGIKPNLVVPKPHTSGATTSPELVAGIIEYFQARGYRRIIILEGSWVGARTAEAFRICDYQALAQTYQVPLVDLQQDASREIAAGAFRLKVCRRALEVDYLINVPVLKGHCQTVLTCALKNLKGCLPNSEKRRFHAMGLHRPIAYLNQVLKQDLIIVDGIMGDLDFEEGGNPVRMDRLIAGTDPVLIDSYAAQLLGFDLKEIPYIGLAERLGVGRFYQTGDQVIELNRTGPAEPWSRTGRVQELARHIVDRDACSACYGSLIHALARLREQGSLARFQTKIRIGQGYRGQTSPGIGIGSCTRGCAAHLEGCPPTAKAMVDFLEKHGETKNLGQKS